MSTANANAQWAARIVDACVAAGVGHAFLSPGSRTRHSFWPSETLVCHQRLLSMNGVQGLLLGWVVVGPGCGPDFNIGLAPFHYGPAVAEADASSLPLVV